MRAAQFVSGLRPTHVFLSCLLVSSARGELDQSQVVKLTAEVKRVAADGKGHPAAIAAMAALRDATAIDLPAILEAMDDANPLALNWLRNVAESAAAKAEFPAAPIEQFLLDRRHGPAARRFAYELLRDRDPGVATKFLPGMLDDPALELRWDAVERLVAESEKLEKEARIPQLTKALDASRDTEQVDRIIAVLKKLDHPVDVVQYYGFLRDWKLVGPFDNTGQRGFDVVYPPEKDLNATSYPGKSGDVQWKEHFSKSEDGVIKLTEIYGPEKGAIVYALTELVSDQEQPAEIRVGCINACKVWMNGEPLMAHEKYHQAMMVDQYVAPVTLKKGPNRILMKICQNEQTESWAQDWMYQLRVTTPDGKVIRGETAAKSQ